MKYKNSIANKYHCQRKYADYLIIGFLLYNQLKTNSEIKYDKHNKKFLLVFIYFFSLYFDSFLYTTYNNDNNLQIGIYLERKEIDDIDNIYMQFPNGLFAVK